MKKRWLFLGGALALAGVGYAAFQHWKLYIPGLIADVTDPIGPTQTVNWAQGPAVAPAGQRPPNIILIVADDLGINDISAFGGGIVPTPAIDRLMQEGATVDSFYAANATCSPSRAAMMTGRYPTRFGFEFTAVPPLLAKNVGHGAGFGPWQPIVHSEVADQLPDYRSQGVPASEVMLPEVLKTAGYHTMHIGKWHLGEARGMRPEDQGFDESLGFAAGAGMFLPKNAPDVVNARLDWDPIDQFLWASLPYAVQWNGGKRFAPGGYVTDWFTDEALRAIDANRNRPFFLYLAYNAPHTPLQALKSDYDKLGHIQDHRDRVYAAMLVALDRSVARVQAKLEADGIADNTLILFTSDNGGAWYVGMDGLNKPYRGWKATFFEGGIRTPLFAKWPARIKPGTKVSGVGSHIDLFATAAAAAGARMPGDRQMDSVSLLPALETGGALPPRTNFWRSGDYRAVRDGDWKLQVSKRPERVWLFNLKDDPTERTDLSKAMPDKVAELKRLIEAQAAEMPKPLWPALIEGPVRIDVPSNAPWVEGQELIYWAN
ncbi:sulfatase-like hydrolase/transferase [Sandaracinobacteroides hominis]|uniref:sulfatase-like hydrolase/transferase n=1 Tax=Sandaracinobacteroides hominis TaxID=2780086 RepID=UPI0018F3106E|nr:sulfatase-like hydrolase/transferase [Sandaracinobacteroides hominis]